jgi:hypothetical protein
LDIEKEHNLPQQQQHSNVDAMKEEITRLTQLTSTLQQSLSKAEHQVTIIVIIIVNDQ